MENLKSILITLKSLGAHGIKISFEDEGALYNEVITMRNLTASVGLQLSIKIGGCEAKRDIVDCMDVNCDSIVAPMVETNFALNKFIKSLECYNYKKTKGFNLETIHSYNNLHTFDLSLVDFITFGRVDFVGSLGLDRNSVDNDDMLNYITNVFTTAKAKKIKCYLGGAISIKSKNFIRKLVEDGLLDRFETRYMIYDVTNIDKFDELLYWGNVFEVEWLKYINQRYMMHANKDVKRIRMIEERININNI
jgi:4-hydroxy-2-oxoheptanedioate aldolase